MMKHWKYGWLLLLALMMLTAPARAQEDQPTTYSLHFTLRGLEPDSRLAKSILPMAERCHESLSDRLPPPFPRRISLIWIDSSSEFAEAIGDTNPDILAVALYGSRVIMFNGPRVKARPINKMQKVFVHELVHVYIASRSASQIPLWLNEGLATNLAYETEWEPNLYFRLRNLFGRLPRLSQLEEKFPPTSLGRSEAYRCSYLAVRYLREEREGLFTLLEQLDDPAFVRSLYTPEFRYAIDQGYRSRFLGTWGMLMAITTDYVLWIGMSFLFIYAYIVKRRRMKIKAAYMAEFEDNYDADIVDIDDL